MVWGCMKGDKTGESSVQPNPRIEPRPTVAPILLPVHRDRLLCLPDHDVLGSASRAKVATTPLQTVPIDTSAEPQRAREWTASRELGQFEAALLNAPRPRKTVVEPT
jgi:hypothetical protein